MVLHTCFPTSMVFGLLSLLLLLLLLLLFLVDFVMAEKMLLPSALMAPAPKRKRTPMAMSSSDSAGTARTSREKMHLRIETVRKVFNTIHK